MRREWDHVIIHSPEKTEVVHVREVLPGDVVLSGAEAAKVWEELVLHFESCALGYDADKAIAILGRAMKGET